MTKNKEPTANRIGNVLMRIDLFGETASFDINGKTSYPSICGTLMSVVIFAAILAYGGKKYRVMLDYEDTMHQTTQKKNSFDETKVMTFDQMHLNFAATLLANAS